MLTAQELIDQSWRRKRIRGKKSVLPGKLRSPLHARYCRVTLPVRSMWGTPPLWEISGKYWDEANKQKVPTIFLYIDLWPGYHFQSIEIITYSAGPQKACRILTILLKARAWAWAFLAVRPFERQDRVKSLVTTFPRASSRQTHNMGMYPICLGSLSLSMRATSKITMKICSTTNVFFGCFFF